MLQCIIYVLQLHKKKLFEIRCYANTLIEQLVILVFECFASHKVYRYKNTIPIFHNFACACNTDDWQKCCLKDLHLFLNMQYSSNFSFFDNNTIGY